MRSETLGFDCLCMGCWNERVIKIRVVYMEGAISVGQSANHGFLKYFIVQHSYENCDKNCCVGRFCKMLGCLPVRYTYN